jgi:hypothetical protein
MSRVGRINAFFLEEKEWNQALINLFVGTVIIIRNFLQLQTFSNKYYL